MKIIKQVGIIFLICWLGLVIEAALPFSFPASIIGMILLFVCLLFGILKIEHIQEKSDFLLSNMAFAADEQEERIMKEIFSSPFFGISLSILAFWAGEKLQKKTKLTACSPLLVAIVLIIGVLLLFDIPYEAYNEGGQIINMFLAPATACLAVSIYTRIKLLKKHWLPILVGCTCGSLASMGSIYLMCTLFHLDEKITLSLLSKSVTTPIAVSITERFSGVVPVTVVAVLITGTLGSILAPFFVRLFRVKDPLEAGLAIGACSHAVGTSKALEIGETEGAMSGLAIGICGIITVIFSLFI